jgi:choline dehydrogenase-like flavoprotein
LRCPELALKRGAERLKMKGRAMEFVAQRKAMPTEQHPGQRAKCHYCGHCMWGCEVDAKYTSANTPIPLGLKTGNLTVLTESMMTRVLMTRDESRVEGIEYRTSDGLTKQIKARALVLSCSAVETARHLLINGIGNSSGQVGRNLASHFGLTVVASFPELRNRRFSNDDGTDYFHSLLTGLYWDKPNPRFSGTYQVQCGAGLHPLKPSIRWAPGYGSLLKRELRELNLSHSAMNMQGSLLASEKKFVDLDAERKDKFGLPLPRVHLHYEDSDVAMAHDMIETCEELIRAAGGEVLSSPGKATVNKLEIDSNHWVGTCRMGNDPRTSVVDKFGRTHDVPNLFIGDASVFGLYPEKNPTLTNIALSWRMSDHLAELFRRKEIA